ISESAVDLLSRRDHDFGLGASDVRSLDVELQSKRSAKGGQSPFGGIRLRSFERGVVNLTWRIRSRLSRPVSFAKDLGVSGGNRHADLRRIDRDEIAAVLP